MAPVPSPPTSIGGPRTLGRPAAVNGAAVAPARLRLVPPAWTAIAAAGFLVCLLRPTVPGQRFTFWGEDGTIFTTQVRKLGIWPSFHTTYAGYLHLIPRSVAAIGSVLPFTWAPPLYFCAACAVSGIAAAIAWRCARALDLSPAASALIAGATLLLPGSGFEVVDNLTNAQWFCLAPAVLFVAAWLRGYRPPATVAVPLLLIAGLTTPLLGLLLPFVLVMTALRRNRLDWAVSLAIVVGSAVQITARLATPTSIAGSGIVAVRGYQFLDLLTFRVADASLLGDRLERLWYQTATPQGAYLSGAVILVLAGLAAWRQAPGIRLACSFLLYTAVVQLVAAQALRPDLGTMASAVGFAKLGSSVALISGRYMGTPALCVFAVAVIAGDAAWRSGRHRSFARVLPAAAILLGVVLVANVPVNLHRQNLSVWRSEVQAARARCVAQNDVGNISILAGPFNGWKVDLTCRQAFGSLR